MDSKIIDLKEFFVIGISVRTTNRDGKSRNDIGGLWEKFMGENLIEKIPNKASPDIFNMYTDYESDYLGPYTTVLGCKVTSLNEIPNGFVGRTIAGGKYQCVISRGEIPRCVLNTWQEIWKSNISRKYLADFDVYGAKAQNPADAEVETYVSIQ